MLFEMQKSNNITQVYLLLPVFTGLQKDIFLHLLTKTIARKKFGDGIESAFTSGLTAERLFVKSKDLSANGNDGSMSQQIRLSKLMGFWAVNNFPSLGRKLLGERWNIPEGRTVTIGNQQTIDDKEIDVIIFKKLKLRVIQLSVSSSTLSKIRHFVSVDASVCKNNPVDISKQTNMFDIQDALIDDCWEALKTGKFIMKTDLERNIAIDCLEIEQSRSEEGSQSVPTVDRSSLNVDVSSSYPANGPELISTAKTSRVFDKTDSAIYNRTVSAVKRCHVVIDSIDSQPTSTCKRSRESKLSKWFDIEAEVCKSDTTIAQLRDTLAESDRTKEQLVVENKKLQKQLKDMESCDEQIKNKLADSNRDSLEVLNENGLVSNLIESDRRANSDPVVDDLRSDMQNIAQNISKLTKWFDPEAELSQSHNTIAKLRDTLAESDCMKKQLVVENERLQKQLIDVESCGEQIKTNLTDSNRNLLSENGLLLEQLNEWKRYANELENKMSESDKTTIEMTIENGQLQGQLNVVNGLVEEIKKNLIDSNQRNVDLITENGSLLEQLHEWNHYNNELENKLRESDQKTIEMTTENGLLQAKLNNVNGLVEEMKKKEASSEQEKIEIVGENQKLWVQLNELKKQFETMVPEFEKQIQSLKKNPLDDASHIQSCEVEDTSIKMSNEVSEANMEEMQLSDRGSTKESVITPEENHTGEIDEDLHLSTEQIEGSLWTGEFETNDPIVLECREKLKHLPFHWLKFKKSKRSKYSPGFVHPAEPGKNPEAQMVTADGYLSNKKYEFFNIKDSLEETERGRHKAEIGALNKFNVIFGANFI